MFDYILKSNTKKTNDCVFHDDVDVPKQSCPRQCLNSKAVRRGGLSTSRLTNSFIAAGRFLLFFFFFCVTRFEEETDTVLSTVGVSSSRGRTRIHLAGAAV